MLRRLALTAAAVAALAPLATRAPAVRAGAGHKHQSHKHQRQPLTLEKAHDLLALDRLTYAGARDALLAGRRRPDACDRFVREVAAKRQSARVALERTLRRDGPASAASRRRVAEDPESERGSSRTALEKARSRRRHGRDVDGPWRRVAAAPRPRRGRTKEAGRARAQAPPRPRLGPDGAARLPRPRRARAARPGVARARPRESDANGREAVRADGVRPGKKLRPRGGARGRRYAKTRLGQRRRIRRRHLPRARRRVAQRDRPGGNRTSRCLQEALPSGSRRRRGARRGSSEWGQPERTKIRRSPTIERKSSPDGVWARGLRGVARGAAAGRDADLPRAKANARPSGRFPRRRPSTRTRAAATRRAPRASSKRCASATPSRRPRARTTRP